MAENNNTIARFKVHSQLADELGTYKYAKHFEALNEIVTNALDQRPSMVIISISEKEITIIDDGNGMDKETITEKYLYISKPNLDEGKRGMFGIGKFGCQAFSNITSITTFPKTHGNGYRFNINWEDVRKCERIDQYGIIIEEVKNPENKKGTTVKLSELTNLLDPKRLKEYLEDKHYGLLINPDTRVRIYVNGDPCIVKEPDQSKVFEVNSKERFELDDKYAPAFPEAKFGSISGKIYLLEKGESKTSGIHVFDQFGVRVDYYSGNDWLNFKNTLEMGQGFRNKIVCFINTEVTNNLSDFETPALKIKSDRSRFLEDTDGFKDLIKYLNAPKTGKFVYGGVFRVLHSAWIENERDVTRKLTDAGENLKEEVLGVLSEILQEEKTVWKVDTESEFEREKPRKKEKASTRGTKQPNRKRLQCPECKSFNYISDFDWSIWKSSDEKRKKELLGKWVCENCTCELNPDRDLHKIRSPKRKQGTIVQPVTLGKGTFDLEIEDLGESGDIALYEVDEEIIFVNFNHAFYKHAYETSTKTLRQHLILAALFAVSRNIAEEHGEDVIGNFNKFCALAHRPWK
jgi:hypothetical protein